MRAGARNFVCAALCVYACGVLEAASRAAMSSPGVLARRGACSATLPDGSVVVSGGAGSAGVTPNAALVNADGASSVLAPMLFGRSRHACVTLADGRVLVAGGESFGVITAALELFDPSSKLFLPVPVA